MTTQTAKSIPFRVIAYRIPTKQFAEIEAHLQFASHLLNSEFAPDWEDLNTACRQIADALENLKWIREKSEAK